MQFGSSWRYLSVFIFQAVAALSGIFKFPYFYRRGKETSLLQVLSLDELLNRSIYLTFKITSKIIFWGRILTQNDILIRNEIRWHEHETQHQNKWYPKQQKSSGFVHPCRGSPMRKGKKVYLRWNSDNVYNRGAKTLFVVTDSCNCSLNPLSGVFALKYLKESQSRFQ